MAPPATSLTLPEAGARRLLLARAVDEADPQGKLISQVERDQAEQRALDETRPAGAPLDPGRYLQARARHLLAAASLRDARVAGLQEPAAWRRAVAWALPLAALLAGAALDRIDNPHQVNLLSPPLLAFLLWNLLVYLGLGIAWLLPRRTRASAGGWRWLDGAPWGKAAAGVPARFHQLWWQAAGALESQRWKQVLHTSALAWALGVALSIVVGGLVREYRVGWESTWLDAGQVHAFLRVLFSPLTALLPVQPFSLAEVAQLHLRSGAPPDAAQARRWVGLYLGLLLLLVALPRLLLALHAAWRRWRLGRAVKIDLADRYFVEVLGRVSPARVVLAVLPAEPATRAGLLQAFRQVAQQPPGRSEWGVILTPRGDALLLLDCATARPAGAPPSRPSALARWLPRLQALAPQAPPVDPGHGADLLLMPGAGAAPEPLPSAAPVVALEPVPCWMADAALLEAIARRLPSYKAPGMARIAQAWKERHLGLLAQSARLVAAGLVEAARESEEVQSGPLNLRRLVDPAERDAGGQARRAAIETVLQRLEQGRARTRERLQALYAVQPAAGEAQHAALREPQGFRVNEAVDSPQAGMAGAASGAALGATVDLMVGGITLGAAAALGALVGGGAAYVAAAWKNRTAPSGASTLQLSDDMLQGLAELSLLDYLAVIHQGRGAELAAAGWPGEVTQAVGQARPRLQALWAQARASSDAGAAVPALAAEWQGLALTVLQALYGPGLAGDAAAPPPQNGGSARP